MNNRPAWLSHRHTYTHSHGDCVALVWIANKQNMS